MIDRLRSQTHNRSKVVIIQPHLSSHLASPDLVDVEPAGRPAAAPGVVVGPQVVAGQRGVEHGQLSLSFSLSGLKYYIPVM